MEERAMSRLFKLCFVAGALAISTPVYAVTIDFEAQGAAAPSNFPTPNVTPPLTISGVTFSGGTLLNNESNSTDLTAVYATGNVGGVSGYSNPISLSFAVPTTSLSFDLVNHTAGTFALLTNTGLTQSFILTLNQIQNFSVSGAAFNSATVTQ